MMKKILGSIGIALLLLQILSSYGNGNGASSVESSGALDAESIAGTLGGFVGKYLLGIIGLALIIIGFFTGRGKDANTP